MEPRQEKRQKIYRIPIKPVAWARAQPNYKLARMFDKQKNEKTRVRIYLQSQHGDEPYFKLPKIEMEFHFQENSQTKNKPDYPLYGHAPDGDNCQKFLFDVMNKLVFEDDRMVVESSFIKLWAKEDMIIIKVTEMSKHA